MDESPLFSEGQMLVNAHAGLRDEFEKRGPWHTIFRVNGVEYGGDEEQYRTDDDPRPDNFIRRFPFHE